tara:strand:+ start:1941 stop:6530 length:4590 start_codon:yes stop_codon:yes gene_type:complete
MNWEKNRNLYVGFAVFLSLVIGSLFALRLNSEGNSTRRLASFGSHVPEHLENIEYLYLIKEIDSSLNSASTLKEVRQALYELRITSRIELSKKFVRQDDVSEEQEETSKELFNQGRRYLKGRLRRAEKAWTAISNPAKANIYLLQNKKKIQAFEITLEAEARSRYFENRDVSRDSYRYRFKFSDLSEFVWSEKAFRFFLKELELENASSISIEEFEKRVKDFSEKNKSQYGEKERLWIEDLMSRFDLSKVDFSETKITESEWNKKREKRFFAKHLSDVEYEYILKKINPSFDRTKDREDILDYRNKIENEIEYVPNPYSKIQLISFLENINLHLKVLIDSKYSKKYFFLHKKDFQKFKESKSKDQKNRGSKKDSKEPKKENNSHSSSSAVKGSVPKVWSYLTADQYLTLIQKIDPELDLSSTERDVRKSVRKMKHDFHPDKAGGDNKKKAEFRTKFSRVVDYFEILTDKKKAEAYFESNPIKESSESRDEFNKRAESSQKDEVIHSEEYPHIRKHLTEEQYENIVKEINSEFSKETRVSDIRDFIEEKEKEVWINVERHLVNHSKRVKEKAVYHEMKPYQLAFNALLNRKGYNKYLKIEDEKFRAEFQHIPKHLKTTEYEDLVKGLDLSFDKNTTLDEIKKGAQKIEFSARLDQENKGEKNPETIEAYVKWKLKPWNSVIEIIEDNKISKKYFNELAKKQKKEKKIRKKREKKLEKKNGPAYENLTDLFLIHKEDKLLKRGFKKVGNFGAHMGLFYMGVMVSTYIECRSTKDPMPCKAFWRGLGDWRGHFGFLLFTIMAEKTGLILSSSYLKFHGIDDVSKIVNKSKEIAKFRRFQNLVGGNLGLAAGSFINDLFVEFSSDPEISKMFQELWYSDWGKKTNNAKIWDRIESYGKKTFGNPEWWKEKGFSSLTLIGAAMGSGLVQGGLARGIGILKEKTWPGQLVSDRLQPYKDWVDGKIKTHEDWLQYRFNQKQKAKAKNKKSSWFRKKKVDIDLDHSKSETLGCLLDPVGEGAGIAASGIIGNAAKAADISNGKIPFSISLYRWMRGIPRSVFNTVVFLQMHDVISGIATPWWKRREILSELEEKTVALEEAVEQFQKDFKILEMVDLEGNKFKTFSDSFDIENLAPLKKAFSEYELAWDNYRRNLLQKVKEVHQLHSQDLVTLRNAIEKPVAFYRWFVKENLSDSKLEEFIKKGYFHIHSKIDDEDVQEDVHKYAKAFFCGKFPEDAINSASEWLTGKNKDEGGWFTLPFFGDYSADPYRIINPPVNDLCREETDEEIKEQRQLNFILENEEFLGENWITPVTGYQKTDLIPISEFVEFSYQRIIELHKPIRDRIHRRMRRVFGDAMNIAYYGEKDGDEVITDTVEYDFDDLKDPDSPRAFLKEEQKYPRSIVDSFEVQKNEIDAINKAIEPQISLLLEIINKKAKRSEGDEKEFQEFLKSFDLVGNVKENIKSKKNLHKKMIEINEGVFKDDDYGSQSLESGGLQYWMKDVGQTTKIKKLKETGKLDPISPDVVEVELQELFSPIN